MSLLHQRLGVEEVEVSLKFYLKDGETMEMKTIWVDGLCSVGKIIKPYSLCRLGPFAVSFRDWLGQRA